MRMIGSLARFLGIALFVGILGAGFMAYFVTGPGPSDGLGRPLTESPLLVRFLFGQDRLWPGYLWFIVDLVVFWGGLGLSFWLVSIVGDSTKVGSRAGSVPAED